MSRVSAQACVVCLVIAAVVAPLGWRLVIRSPTADAGAVPSYLPSVEATRVRRAFDGEPIWGLQDMQPGVVVIGDSMAGRVDPERLDALLDVRVAPILYNATGSGYWYLAFKNYVVASQVRPRWTLIFFRDTNLTDLTFRLLGDYRDALDSAARDLEPELDALVARRLAGPWYRAHRLFDELYDGEVVRQVVEPGLTSWPARVVAGSRGGRQLQSRTNARFTLDQLRPMPLSDISVISEDDTDFTSNVSASVLPALLRLAREHEAPLVFVRTQRRAATGGLRPESPALAKYMRDLRVFIEREGGVLIDDQFDPDVTRLEYDDLDHIAPHARGQYTEILARKIRALTQ